MTINIERLHQVREQLMTQGSWERHAGKTTYHCHVVAGMLQVLEPHSTIFVVMEWINRFRHFQDMLIDTLYDLDLPELVDGRRDVKTYKINNDSILFTANQVAVKFISPDTREACRGYDRDIPLIIDVEEMPSRFYSNVYTVDDIREVMEEVRYIRGGKTVGGGVKYSSTKKNVFPGQKQYGKIFIPWYL